MNRPKKYTRGLDETAHTFHQTFRKDVRDEDHNLLIETLTFKDDFLTISGERADGTSFQEVIAQDLTGTKTEAQLASTTTKFYCSAKTDARISAWETDEQDAWNEILSTPVHDQLGNVTQDPATIGDVILNPNTELEHLIEKAQLRVQYNRDKLIKKNLLDPMAKWLADWKEGGKKRKAQDAIQNLERQIVTLRKDINEMKSDPNYESKGYLKRSVQSNLKEIEKVEIQVEKAKKKYEDTYDETYVKKALLKRSLSTRNDLAEFKQNKKRNAEIRKKQEQRLADINETDGFLDGSGGGDDVTALSASEAEQLKRLLAKRANPSTPGTASKAKRARTAPTNPKHFNTVDAENAEELTADN